MGRTEEAGSEGGNESLVVVVCSRNGKIHAVASQHHSVRDNVDAKTQKQNADSRFRQRYLFEVHGHLNYRYTMLWRHKNAKDTNAKRDYGDSICAYESGLIVCRVWMEFLGLGVTYAKGPPALIEKHDYFSFDGHKTDEVKVVDLGGNFVKLSNLTQAERRLLATVYHMAHKATAHFTLGGHPKPAMRGHLKTGQRDS